MNIPIPAKLTEIFVALASLQVEQQVSFYSQLLSSQPKVNTASYAEFRLLGLRLAIFSPSEQNSTEFSASSSGLMSLCLEVEDLEAAIALLNSIGHAPPGNIMQASHGKEIYAYDLDGNRLILHQSP